MSASRTVVFQGEGITITERLENAGDRPIYQNCRSIRRSVDLLEDYVEVLQEEDGPLLSLKGPPLRRGEMVGQEGPLVVDAGLFGTAIYSTSALSLAVSAPSGK